jgi:hypothetical protein
MVSMHTSCFNIKQISILPAECIYVFRIIVRVNRDYFVKQRQPVD